MPVAVKRGESVTLYCLYDIEEDPLYTVNWYKGRREFYRFAPEQDPVIKTFSSRGLKVNVSDQEKFDVML